MSREQTGRRPVAIVFGTRPEIIKLAGVARLLGDDICLIHSGQHDSYEMATSFLDEFGLGHPDVQLAVGGQSRGRQIGDAIRELDEQFEACPPAAVVVQGDTNTTLAAALAANARHIPVVHVEAGLRSHDRAMPEEHNRVLTDHLADVCCAPTAVARSNLGWQGRYTLPLAVGLPILCGVALAEEPRRLLPRRRLALVFGVTFFVAQFLAFFENLRRYTVGLGGRLHFWYDAEWSPPLPSSFLLVSYAVLLVALALWFWAGTGSNTDESSPAATQVPGLE